MFQKQFLPGTFSAVVRTSPFPPRPKYFFNALACNGISFQPRARAIHFHPVPTFFCMGLCISSSGFMMTKTLPFSQSPCKRLLNDTTLSVTSRHGKLRNVDDLCDNYRQIDIAVPSRLRSQSSPDFRCQGYGLRLRTIKI